VKYWLTEKSPSEVIPLSNSLVFCLYNPSFCVVYEYIVQISAQLNVFGFNSMLAITFKKNLKKASTDFDQVLDQS
jgi:hypothetical protein